MKEINFIIELIDNSTSSPCVFYRRDKKTCANVQGETTASLSKVSRYLSQGR